MAIDCALVVTSRANLIQLLSGFPPCLRAVAACEQAVLSVRELTSIAPLTVFAPHCVTSILTEQCTSHLSTSRWLKYNTTLLGMPDVMVKRCTTLNPATLVPLPEDSEPHSCVAALQDVCTPRPDLTDTPIPNADLVFYVDGSASRDPTSGSTRAGFAVVSDHDLVVSSPLPGHFSAQAAELVALTEACKLAEGKSVNIYTDSRYAFGVVHDFGTLWRYRGFLKSDGKPVLNHKLVARLLDSVLQMCCSHDVHRSCC